VVLLLSLAHIIFLHSFNSFTVEEAMRYVKAQKLKEKQREEDEKKLFGDDVDEQPKQQAEGEGEKQGKDENAKPKAKQEDVEMEQEVGDEEIVEDTLWDWNDQNQVGESYH
jgi:hypothetical protein